MKKRFKQRTTTTRISKPPYHRNTRRELGLAEPSLLERQKPVWKPPCPGGAAAVPARGLRAGGAAGHSAAGGIPPERGEGGDGEKTKKNKNKTTRREEKK